MTEAWTGIIKKTQRFSRETLTLKKRIMGLSKYAW